MTDDRRSRARNCAAKWIRGQECGRVDGGVPTHLCMYIYAYMGELFFFCLRNIFIVNTYIVYV